MRLELHEEIRLARKRMGMTQEQLAKALGVERHTISRYERPDTLPRRALVAEMLERIETLKENRKRR